MYYPNDIEEICTEQKHINEVLAEIRRNIPAYLEQYINTEGGDSPTDTDLNRLKEAFNATEKARPKKKNIGLILQRLLDSAIDDFEKDRKYYEDILDLQALKEYKEDVNSFKNTVLHNQVPIIRHTLQNKSAKELDKYRKAFNIAQPGDLFKVVHSIVKLATKWKTKRYDSKLFEKVSSYEELDYIEMDAEENSAFGVIGGGIKSHFIYKMYPFMYPNRSRDAIWALWYLTNKKIFGCKEDSEFLMIDTEKVITQQNYFYPYALFAFYAQQIYLILKDVYVKNNVKIPIDYRFVVVDSFLSFVARQHQEEIDLLKRQAQEGYHYEY